MPNSTYLETRRRLQQPVNHALNNGVTKAYDGVRFVHFEIDAVSLFCATSEQYAKVEHNKKRDLDQVVQRELRK